MFSQTGPSIHHLLFADDSLFLCKANKDQCRTLSQILLKYGMATGQTMNISKSFITVGSKVDKSDKIFIQN